MIELTNEREIEPRLPFLNEGCFEASVIHSVRFCKYIWESEPKYTDCHAHASSEAPVRLGPVSRW